MKKTLLTILLGAFGVMVLAAPVLAATNVSFTPVNVSVRQGQNFTLTIGVNPQGVKNYTAKIELRYPADLLEVKSFTFANGWVALAQPGYDLTDNANGVLIKTAGYPGGVSSAVTFGTVSFLAKKSGNGTITLSGDSFVLDAVNQNVLVSVSVQTTVVITAAPVQATPTTGKEPAKEPTEEPTEGLAEETATTSSQDQVAAATEAGTGTSLYYIIAIILLLGAGFVWQKNRSGVKK